MSNQSEDTNKNNSDEKQPNKKRYKKLWKRATQIPAVVKSEMSGISTPSEWSEFQDLHKRFGSPSILGPCVHWRNGKVRECVESADQRDILHRFLMHHPSQTSASGIKKRKREDQDEIPNIPSWATLSNPYACEHVCVIELHCWSDAQQQQSSFASSWRDHLAELATQHKKHVFSTPVRWFQVDQPLTCVSQAVMYRAQPKSSKEEKTKETSIKNKDDLYKALDLLKLKPSELVRENYPVLPPDSLTQYTDLVQSVELSEFGNNRKPSEIDFESAKKLVADLSVSLNMEKDTHRTLQCVASTSFGEKQSRIFAVDCEMVRTAVGLELARVTLIEVEEYSSEKDIAYKLVWDEIIKPVHPVVDYLTVYSGMTKDIIDNATVSIEQVQAALVATIRSDDILIGHSLENDLRVMQFAHDNVVDTAILFRPSSGRFKYSLKALAARLLRKQIQKSNSSHCSLEDAATALKLASRRAIDGTSFQMFDAVPINRVHSVASDGNTTVCIGPSEWIHQHITSQPNSIHALGCESIKDANHKAVCSWIAGPSRRARLVWAKFELQDLDDGAKMKDVTNDLLSKMSPSTVVTFMLQEGYKEANTLSNLRKARRNPKTTVAWTGEDEEKWIKVMNTARVGTCFWVGTSHTQN